jgi:beta-glucosidase
MPASCFYREGDDFSKITQPFELNGNGKGKVAIANITYQMSGKPNVSCPDYKTVSVTPDKLNESWSISWWTERHEKKLAEAKQLGKSAQVVFIGDSITEGWEKSGAPVWQRYYQPLNGFASASAATAPRTCVALAARRSGRPRAESRGADVRHQ